MSRIAIVGLACRYPDADTPEQLWANVLAGRRSFRRLPEERMRLADYWSPDPAAPDRFYADQAAVIEDYVFDRVRYRIAGSTFRATDLTHWLALDVAAQALADAGFPDGDELPRERTTVVVGNTLTGEFTRANLMRLRWPYVGRVLGAALREQGWQDARVAEFLAGLEKRYKQPFPPVDEDTLAGGLSNTIAGRICNHFDLKGGGYTVDAACSSSLLSVATASRSLLSHESDVAIAGGVDLSIDPFEIIGFAKTGALATGEMRVYDRGSTGFWPGEGCGMVVLMREADARAAGRPIYATIAGYGISSDGKGGITRPEVAGYRLAVRRAYRHAGFGADSVSLYEGHGTGTPVGNDTELQALAAARRQADPAAPPAAIGSIKAMIGHTKAAAGVAGLIKATLAVHHALLPPTVGCHDPHPVLREPRPALRILPVAEPWPADQPIRAGVMAMGFGGINTHIVIEGSEAGRRSAATRSSAARAVAVSRFAAGDGTELLVFDAEHPGELAERVSGYADRVERMSYGELGDLAVATQQAVADRAHRAAVLARSPAQAAQRLRQLAGRLAGEASGAASLSPADGIYLGNPVTAPRIGLLFPGQGSGESLTGGVLRRRFAVADQAYGEIAPAGGDPASTAIAQPWTVTGSLAGLRVLESLGLEASLALGHSLGELTALHWAGCFDAAALLRIAAARGNAMATYGEPGAMLSIAAGPERVRSLLADTDVVIAGYNGPAQTTVAGPVAAVEQVQQRAGAGGLASTRLTVRRAFHSPLVADAAPVLARHLATERLTRPQRPVASTITGGRLDPDLDLSALLERQVTSPVRFTEAIAAVADEVDLFLEVGPGSVLARLASAACPVPAVSIDTDSASLAPLWSALGSAYVLGAPVRFAALYEGRPVRQAGQRKFFANPCESAPDEAAVATTAGQQLPAASAAVSAAVPADPGTPGSSPAGSTVDLIRGLVAARVELPTDSVRGDSRLLDDLHLSSITVGQVYTQAARELGLPVGQSPTSLATATVAQLATALDELRATARDGDLDPPDPIAGVDAWVRSFQVEFSPVPAQDVAGSEPDGEWEVFAPPGHRLAGSLREALGRGRVGDGVLVCLSPDCDEAELGLALAGAQAAVSRPAGRLVVVQYGRGAAAMVRTARLEAPGLRTTVVDTPPVPEAVARVIADVAATTGHLEVHYDREGRRRQPVLRPYSPRPAEPPLTSADLLLVTGGGKGITAECALALARDSGARLAILGRSDPGADEELARNLARIADAGIDARYLRADVTDAGAVRAAVAQATAALGPVTAVLHGAGLNQPAALPQLDSAAVRQSMAPKLDGLAAVLDAVDPARLRLLVTFGSIIGRAGLRGEAHYATANDWLAHATFEAGRALPRCRVLCVEWSVWAGVGMGERLSVVQSLTREGITPITVDDGVAGLRELVADPKAPPVVVVTGRVGGVDTVDYDLPELPLLRFVDKPLVHYPGVELVVETTLTGHTDPYLTDHLLDGDLLFPAVLGLEAMAQAASAVRGRPGLPRFEQVELSRPVVVPRHGATTVRIAALVSGDDAVTVAVRSSETSFQAEHFRAVLRFDGTVAAPAGPAASAGTAGASSMPPVALAPETDLYGELLFQSGRFQRLRRYRWLAARQVLADAAPAADDWFAGYLPGELLLGDPGVRDAFLHGLQVCVPDATLLPAAVERIWIDERPPPAGELSFAATERRQDGDSYLYDIVVRDADGRVRERWEGLRLHAVRRDVTDRRWPPALLGPLLQRRAERLLGTDADLAVVVEPDGGVSGQQRTARAIRRAVDESAAVSYRPDGRPELTGGRPVSASHAGGLTAAVVARYPVGCDLEPVVARTATAWTDLLHPHGIVVGLLVDSVGDDRDVAATRVWCALEALQKAGEPRHAPLSVATQTAGGVLLRSGSARVATFVLPVKGFDQPVVFAVALREEA